MTSVTGLQNAIGEVVAARQLQIYMMTADHLAKTKRGEDTTELQSLIFTNQHVVKVLLDILRAEGEPGYAESLEASFPRLLEMASRGGVQ